MGGSLSRDGVSILEGGVVVCMSWREEVYTHGVANGVEVFMDGLEASVGDIYCFTSYLNVCRSLFSLPLTLVSLSVPGSNIRQTSNSGFA